MFSLIDLHCHTLFDVDDGARNEQMMKDMLDSAYSDGIRAICFTPHFKIYEFSSDDEIYSYIKQIESSFNVARQYVSAKYNDLQLFLGNEIMYHSDVFDSLSSKKCNFLANSAYALLEFSPDTSAFEIRNTVSKLLRKGVRPVIAHIERYSALVKDFSLVEELKDMGALLQVNSRAILRFKLGKVARLIKTVLKKHMVDIVASDAHNSSSFPQRLSKACDFVAKRYGSNYAKRIFHDTPLAILNNEKIF
ncbi:MAG: PHP domain-containing protein [Clostridia bacterium]|nr:PHP domain-containing protein [Clostridia bacterium]